MTDKIINFRNVNENPCNMCMPMGGILPFKGIEEAMVILHGSQGCATYMRRHIAEHFNEPVDVASSSLNEKGTIYGGEANLKQGLANIIRVYNPKIIGVLTTCLAETIGEDIERISAEFLQETHAKNLKIVAVSTPGYGGSQTEGYWQTLKKIVMNLADDTTKHPKINLIIPNISPADIRELKSILASMEIEYTLLPDISDTMDSGFAEEGYKKIPSGGTKLADIANMAGAVATVEMSLGIPEDLSPGKYLLETFGVPIYKLPIPMGIENTDIFLKTLAEITGKQIPKKLLQERGRLVDGMIDSHKYNAAGRSVVFGEPELVYAISRTLLENGITPVVIATGSSSASFKNLLNTELDKFKVVAEILKETDFSVIRQKSKKMAANIAIGHSDGRYLTEKEGLPLVRIGFPIHDRVGGQRILSVGYLGTMMFLDRITNTLLENKLKSYRKETHQKYFVIGGKEDERKH